METKTITRVIMGQNVHIVVVAIAMMKIAESMAIIRFVRGECKSL